jgi:3-deoxy-D-manno-octulosonic-acid transferase
MFRPLDAVYAALLGVSAPVWGTNLVRTGKWRTDWRGRRGFAPEIPAAEPPTVLLHGVSVGEVVAAEPLVRRLRAEGARVVVSTTTDTGTDRARALFGDTVPVVRYPLDFSWMVRRFLDRVRPDVVGLLELEVWPHFTAVCAARDIPVAVVNGRLSASSFAGYRRVRSLLAPSFRRLSAVGAQSEAYAKRFRALGVPGERVRVSGTMKWDVELPDDLERRAEAMRSALGVPRDRPVVVAISTGPGEEAGLLAHTPEEVALVVVPRKPERFEEVAALAPWVRRSLRPDGGAAIDEGGLPPGDERGPSRFLVDTMGEAEVATAFADVVVVGRTFNGMGGSNPIPAAALGKPIVTGPDHHNFLEVTAALSGAAACIPTLDALPGVLVDGPALARMAASGPSIVERERGATDRNAELLLSLLRSAAPR